MKKDKKYLDAELAALLTLAPVCEAPGFKVIEVYARKQFEASVEEVFNEKSIDPAQHMASCAFYRGQGETWRVLSEMRTVVASRIAGVRQQLDALRKEDADGNVER